MYPVPIPEMGDKMNLLNMLLTNDKKQQGNNGGYLQQQQQPGSSFNDQHKDNLMDIFQNKNQQQDSGRSDHLKSLLLNGPPANLNQSNNNNSMFQQQRPFSFSAPGSVKQQQQQQQPSTHFQFQQPQTAPSHSQGYFFIAIQCNI